MDPDRFSDLPALDRPVCLQDLPWATHGLSREQDTLFKMLGNTMAPEQMLRFQSAIPRDQAIVRFANGLGASVITFDKRGDGTLDYEVMPLGVDGEMLDEFHAGARGAEQAQAHLGHLQASSAQRALFYCAGRVGSVERLTKALSSMGSRAERYRALAYAVEGSARLAPLEQLLFFQKLRARSLAMSAESLAHLCDRLSSAREGSADPEAFQGARLAEGIAQLLGVKSRASSGAWVEAARQLCQEEPGRALLGQALALRQAQDLGKTLRTPRARAAKPRGL